jgi:hypothetical protein
MQGNIAVVLKMEWTPIIKCWSRWHLFKSNYETENILDTDIYE